ncbi:MAG: N-methyl-D-aspartate receptor NMDAR2C subunit [Candidatus Competibacteraceae bacterium]
MKALLPGAPEELHHHVQHYGKRWQAVWSRVGSPLTDRNPDPLLLALIERYSERHRAYHTLAHLEECLAQFDEAWELANHPADVELALWFHDAIYDPHRTDNEARSAAWAKASLLARGVSQMVAERVEALILATRHERSPTTPDAALVVDIDLAILSAPAARFDAYERQIRQEYAWVPEAVFRSHRRRFLEGLLERDRIYITDAFFERYEPQARRNIHRSLRRSA